MGKVVLRNEIFNSEIEYSIRIIVLLGEYGRMMSLDEIFLVDFISCYPTHFEVEGIKLYGDNSKLKGEISLRKEKVWNAIKVLLFKDLICLTISPKLGYLYSLSQEGLIVDSKLSDEYITKYRGNVDLVYDRFSNCSEFELMRRVSELIKEESGDVK